MCLFAGRTDERDVMSRLDLPLVVFHRRFLEGFIATAMVLGGMFLLLPGTTFWSPTFGYVSRIPEEVWGKAFLVIGVTHMALLWIGKRRTWTAMARTWLLAVSLMLYVMMSILIALENPLSWHMYTTFTFQVVLSFVCLARARYEQRHAEAAEDAGMA